MAIQDFTALQILTASQMDTLQANDYNWTVSTKTASYVLTAADKGTRVVMNSASATTITVNTSLFSAGDTLQIINIGTGTCTVTAGTATVTTSGSLALAQWGGGTLYFTSASASIFFPYGGVSYGAGTGGTGVTAATVGGVNYNWTSFISTGTFTVTRAGLFDVLVFGGGCGGGGDNSYSGGGASGGISRQTIYLSANATVTIGGGGAVDASGSPTSIGAIPDAVAAAGGNYTAVIAGRYGTLGAMSGKGVGTNTGPTNVQGYAGGESSTNAGGGGGSTTALGANASANVGGNGGAGFDVSAFIAGSALFKGAGGGGGAGTTGGTGGSSIGGNGASGATNGTAAAANTASGGGSRGSSGTAGAGGSGIIYIRWKV